MKTMFLIIGLIALSIQCFSQDLIIKSDGDRFKCKIISEDSIKVHIIINKDSHEIKTYLNKSDIQRVVYEKDIKTGSFQDSIVTKKGFFEKQYYYLGNKLTINDLSNLLEKNLKASNEFQKAKTINVFAQIFSGAGAFLLGWTTGGAISGKKVDWSLVGIGGGLIIVSIPIIHAAEVKAKNAVDIYNKGIDTNTLKDIGIEFKVKNLGFSFSVNF